MRSATLWKSVAGVAGALGLLLGGAGAAGAAAVAPHNAHTASASTASDDNPIPDCHSSEHAGFGAIYNCKQEHKH
jgi:hypothetical protein